MQTPPTVYTRGVIPPNARVSMYAQLHFEFLQQPLRPAEFGTVCAMPADVVIAVPT